MIIDPVAATVAGVLAAQCMEVPGYVQRALGMSVLQDVFAENGAIVRAPVRYRRVVGWLVHAVAAILIVLLYSTFFAAVGNDHLLWWGLIAGAVHGAVGGLVIGAWSDLHPDMPDRLPAPGVFYRHYGRRDAVTFCGGHLLFGVAAGISYVLLHSTLAPAAIL